MVAYSGEHNICTTKINILFRIGLFPIATQYIYRSSNFSIGIVFTFIFASLFVLFLYFFFIGFILTLFDLLQHQLLFKRVKPNYTYKVSKEKKEYPMFR